MTSVVVRAIERHTLQEHTIHQPTQYKSIAITDEHPQLAASIAQALSTSGADVTITQSPSATAELLVVTSALGEGDAKDIHWRALAQAKAFRAAGGQSMILLQDTGGRYAGGPSQGWHGGMAALARTAALEWPDMSVRCIDIAVDPNDFTGTAQRLLEAFGSMLSAVAVDSSGQHYSLQAGKPLLPKLQSTTVKHTNEDDVWLVSGGARGVTASCIEAMAQKTAGRFALLGRSLLTEWPADIAQTDDITELRRLLAASALVAGERPVPKDIERMARQTLAGQDIRNTLARLKSAGVSAHYYPCDIADQQQVMDVVAKIQAELGPIKALVHGAGVLADSKLVDKTRQEFERVFDTKVGGLRNLFTALGDQPLSHIAFFSSAAAFYGNIGQSDYAMANEILNRVARSLKLRWPDAVIKSFNWGPWDSGMVDKTLADYFKERGISLIPVEQGAALFANQMLSGEGHVVELLVGEPWAG